MFLNSLVLEPHGAEKWKVHIRLLWACGRCETGDAHFVVPEGFITDLASFPRWLWWIKWFNPNGRSRRPAVLHDWLYTACLIPKRDADKAFREALIDEGVNPTAAKLMYWAVRAFGHGEFKRRRARITPWA